MLKIYSKPGCEDCNKAKEYLNAHNIDYEEIDLSVKENREARKYYRSLGIRTLPIIVGPDWILQEWNEEDFKSLLKQNQGLTKEDELKIKERLEKLGYL